MKKHQWLCVSCSRTGECTYFDLYDMVQLPDMTIGQSHHTVSPGCTTKEIHFVIKGQVFQWTGGGQTPQAAASLPQFVRTENILRLITLYKQKVVVVDSKALKTRTQSFKYAIGDAGRKTEILLYEGLPHNPGKLFFSRIEKHIRNRKHVVILVGGKGASKRWQYMLKKRRKFSLLRQSSSFQC